MTDLGSLQRGILEKYPPFIRGLPIVNDEGSTRGGLCNDLFGPLIGSLRLGNCCLIFFGSQPLPAGRVSLLREDLNNVLVLSNLLFKGLLVLLNGPLSPRHFELSELDPIGKGASLVEGYFDLRIINRRAIADTLIDS